MVGLVLGLVAWFSVWNVHQQDAAVVGGGSRGTWHVNYIRNKVVSLDESSSLPPEAGEGGVNIVLGRLGLAWSVRYIKKLSLMSGSGGV